MRYPNFIGPSYRALSTTADAEELINLYVAKNESAGAKTPYYLCPTPGGTPVFTVEGDIVRGMFAQQGRAFVVCGGRVEEFYANHLHTFRGAVANDHRPVTISTNGDGGDQILVTSGNKYYILDRTTNNMSEIGSGALMGGMLGTFFFVFDATTGTIKSSASYDGTTWNGAAIAQRGTAPDPWRAMVVANARVYMIGEETSDVYYNAGTFPFPLSPIANAVIPYGTCAPFSCIDFNGSVTWVSQTKHGDRKVVAAAGNTSADVISTRAMEAELATYPRVDDAESLVFEMLGISFLVINFRSANASWAYNVDGGWCKLGTWNPGLSGYDAWHARCHAFAFGRHYVGDPDGGVVSTLSHLVGTDVGGGILRRQRTAPCLQSELRRVVLSNFILYLQSGLASQSGAGADPTIMAQMTKDGGSTYGLERWRRIGRVGQRGRRIRWSRFGSGRDIGINVVMTDPSPLYIMDAFINQVGNA